MGRKKVIEEIGGIWNVTNFAVKVLYVEGSDIICEIQTDPWLI